MSVLIQACDPLPYLALSLACYPHFSWPMPKDYGRRLRLYPYSQRGQVGEGATMDKQWRVRRDPCATLSGKLGQHGA
jgi:hypothetical protein